MRFRAWLGRLWLRATGWTLEGEPPEVPKAVLIAAPHDTNWDLPFTLAAIWALRIELGWTGKKTLFRWPFGRLMRGLGGIAIDRAAPGGIVEEIAARIRERESLLLAIPPEGTRSETAYWKSGFYRIALAAGVPILCGFIDYPRKRLGLGGLFLPSGDAVADMEQIRIFYREIGRLPEATVTAMRLREELAGGPPPSDTR